MLCDTKRQFLFWLVKNCLAGGFFCLPANLAVGHINKISIKPQQVDWLGGGQFMSFVVFMLGLCYLGCRTVPANHNYLKPMKGSY